MSRHSLPATLLLLLLAVPAAAQRDDRAWLENCEQQARRSDRAQHCEIRPFTTTLRAGRLIVDAAPNGGIVVRGGNVSQAEVSARVQVHAATNAEAQELAREVRIVAGDGVIRSDGPASVSGSGWSVTYYVTVPRTANLELTTHNGPVSVTDVSGRIRADTENGPLQLEDLGGDVHARTRNGPLTVVVRGSRWDGAGLDAETRNGPVRLLIPDGYSAALEIGTVRGPMNLGFAVPVTVTGNLTGRMETTLGSGGPRIRAVTTNGPFTLGRP